MEFDENLLALFDRYHDKQMLDEEIDAFEIRLNSDHSFKEDFIAYKTLRKAIVNTGYQQMENKISSWEAKIAIQTPQNKSTKWAWLGIAASVSLIIMIGTWWIFLAKSSCEEIFVSYYEVYPNVITDRGSHDLLKDGLFDYSSKNYQGAALKFEEYLKDYPQNLEATFYLGQSKLAVGETQKAIILFESILKEKRFQLIEPTQWYLSLSYLKEEKYIPAIELLKLITLDNNHAYGTKAEELLKTIN